MAAVFPTALVSTTELPNNRADATTSATNHKNDHNQIADELIAVETELGIDPSGTLDATVKDRFLSNESLIERLRRRYEVFDDFNGVLSSTVNAPFRMSTNGAGSGTNAVTVPDNGSAGVIDQATGSTTSGRTAIRADLTALLRFGGGRTRFATRMRLPTLSDGTETFQYRAGFGDVDNGAHQDGAYFEYDQAQSANWRCVTANGNTRTASTTSVAVATATWVRLEIDVNAAGTSVDFKIDGTTVATITTNIPTSGGAEVGVGSWIVKSAGTTSRTAQLDYMGASVEFTTRR